MRNGTELTVIKLNSAASARQLPFPPLSPHVRSIGNECAVSPDGNRVAYVIDAVEPDPFLARFARWLPHGLLGWCRAHWIEISGLDGSDARPIADIDTYFNTRCTLDLEWLPDGKHLSFCGRPQIKGGPALYTVDAD